MRLLVVSSWLPYPPDNGSRMRAFHLLQQFSRRHTLTLLSFGVPREPEDVAPLRVLCERVELVPPGRLEKERLTLRGLFSPVPRHLVQTRSAEMQALVTAAIAGHDAAIGLQIDAARYLVDATPRMPAVFDEIEVGVLRDRYVLEQDPILRLRHGLTWWKFRRFVRFLVGRFERTTVVSAQERDYLRALGCDMARIVIVPNGIDVPDVSPAPVRAARLIYPGSVTYSANLDAIRFFVREVLPLVRRSRPDVAFWVTGTTEGVDIDDLAAIDGVTFTGRVPDVTSLICESAACVVPLRIGGGTRLKILHAMAAATPVVSTSKGIEGLEVEPEQHLLVADSPGDFAAQVLRLLADPVLSLRLVSAARQFVQERHAWEPIAQTLERVVEGAVEDHRARRLGGARR